jgi:hypothetical protein
MSNLGAKVISTLMFVAILAGSSFAQIDYGFEFTKAGSAGFQSLKIGVGAREIGMGQAASATTNDANAVFWNVGALPLIEGPQVRLSHNEWLVGSRVDAAVAATHLGSYTFALSIFNFQIQEFEETTVTAPTGTGRLVSAGDFVFGLAAARRFTDKLTIGVHVKYLVESLDEDSYSNLLFDVGTLYFTGFRQLRLAFTLQHFGPEVDGLRGQDFRMPLLFRIAVADDLIDSNGFKVVGSAELVHPTDNNEWVNVGLETTIVDLLALRAGYRLNVDEGAVSVGAGLRPSLGSMRLVADYAYSSLGTVFGATHRITVGLSL